MNRTHPSAGERTRALADLLARTAGRPACTADGWLEGAGLSASDGLREPLEAIEADLRSAPPTPSGAWVVNTAITGALERHRVLRALPDRRPTRPVVIVGWYRSGTTFLQQLLQALPGYGVVPMHRMVDPLGQRGSRLKAGLGARGLQLLAPELRSLHPVRASGPEECWLWLSTELVADAWHTHWSLPRYGAWLERADRLGAYQAWARAAAHLEAELGHRLVLKYPGHLLGLRELIEVVPDARLVWTHRDPIESVSSYAHLSAVQHRTVYGRWEPERAGLAALHSYRQCTERGRAAREDGAAAAWADLDFVALRDDPVAAVQQVAAALELSVDTGALTRQSGRLRSDRRVRRLPIQTCGLDAGIFEDVG